jgi:hypothetical protein
VTLTDDAARSTPASGLRAILVATVVAGLASYVLTWLVPRVVGFAEYRTFALFWAALYLVIGALLGIQQEITRGTRVVARGEPPRVNRARNFAAGAALVVLAAVLVSGIAWAPIVFPDEGWAIAVPLAFATSGYVAVAVMGGTLYGLAQWRWVATFIVVDSVLRLVIVAALLLFSSDPVVLAWGAAVPFPATLLILWFFVRHRVIGHAQLDVGYRQVTWNVARTVLASASTALMVSGLPLVLGIVRSDVAASVLSMMIIAITFVRAPLVIVAMSLQSYLIVRFRTSAHLVVDVIRIIGAVAVLAGVLSAVAWLLGPAIFAWLFPGEPVPEGWLFAVLVASSGLVAGMCVSGAALLSRSLHFCYALGWVIGAGATVALLAVPGDVTSSTAIALTGAPLAGLVVHLAAMRGARGALSGSS